MSAFADENGIVPVRLTVKEFKDKENSLYALITLEKIETEIKDRGESFATTPTPYPVSEMSIPDIVSKIKPTDGNILKYLPDKLLNAEYLYSTQDKRGDTNIEAWDYFYVPIKIGDETAGVRIAIRAVSNPKGSQIYNWGIKNDTSLGGVGHTPFGSNSNGTSSDVSKANIPPSGNSVNTIVYEKAVDGSFYVVEAVPDSKAKKLRLITAYISKKTPSAQVAHANKSRESTPEASLHTDGVQGDVPSPKTNIPQNGNAVNNKKQSNFEKAVQKKSSRRFCAGRLRTIIKS